MSKTVIFSLLFIPLSLFSQDMASLPFKFGYKKFNELKRNNTNNYFLKDSTKVLFGESENEYQEDITPHNSKLHLGGEYYKKTKTLKSSCSYFENFPIGIRKEYDEKGVLIKQINNDESFPFSLEETVLKMKKEFNVDIESIKPEIHVSRTVSINRNISVSVSAPFYNIQYRNEKFDLTIIEIDGKSGGIIFHRVYPNME